MSTVATHGSYTFELSPTLGGTGAILRRDSDHQRTVAFIDSRSEWERFVAALDSGADEVAAVHAIDVAP